MSFLKNAGLQKHKINIEVEVSCHPDKIDGVINNLQNICSKLTAEEIEILSKVANKPAIKQLAFSKAKQFV